MAKEIKNWSDFEKMDRAAMKAGEKARVEAIAKIKLDEPDELNINKSTVITLPNNMKILVTIKGQIAVITVLNTPNAKMKSSKQSKT